MQLKKWLKPFYFAALTETLVSIKNLWVWSITSPFFPRLQGGPKKRVVQPRLIGPAAKTSKKESNSVSDQTTESLTAAVAASAASAAIAATQPFLKVTKGCTDYMI